MKKYLYFFIVLFFTFTSLNAGIVVLNGLTHTYKVENGKVYKGKIEIENTSNNTQNVKLFLQDFSYKSDGSITYTNLHTNKRSNAEWIKLNTNLLTLKGKEKTEILYEINISDKLINVGSYWSVIIVEPVEDIKPNNDKFGVNITSIVRYAIQIITDYKTDNANTDLKFENIKVEKEEGRKILKIGVINNGDLYCKPIASIELYNNKGEKVGTYSSLAMGLLPNNSKSFYIDIDKVLPEKYNAVIIATDEEENSFAINVELEIKND
ncbi:hypothetical protein [Chishuiella sp.]|uniref:hypothetical protein n=1 Tax=Chishuiella sp. TaxID=1969467 RepID=UPI0028B03F7B|nr:hypothetical protein [Chishuiella sp.]